MNNILIIVAGAVLAASVTARSSGIEVSKPDVEGFKRDVAPLLENYCVDCHGPDDPEAGLSLSNVNPNMRDGPTIERWRMVDDQVRFGDMPPDDVDQPAAEEREVLLKWIRQELRKTQMPGVLPDQKLLLPQFGNYVDHEFLFAKRLERVYPTRPRIWRVRPAIYNNTMPRLAERVSGLANGLNTVRLATVGSYQPNPWGLHDVYGNVAEWCINHAIRGGSWTSVAENCRSAYRDSFSSRNEQNFIGYRLVIQKLPPNSGN